MHWGVEYAFTAETRKQKRGQMAVSKEWHMSSVRILTWFSDGATGRLPLHSHVTGRLFVGNFSPICPREALKAGPCSTYLCKMTQRQTGEEYLSGGVDMAPRFGVPIQSEPATKYSNNYSSPVASYRIISLFLIHAI